MWDGVNVCGHGNGVCGPGDGVCGYGVCEHMFLHFRILL